MYESLRFMNEKEVISNIGALLPNRIESSLYHRYHHRYIRKHILDALIIGPTLGNYI